MDMTSGAAAEDALTAEVQARQAAECNARMAAYDAQWRAHRDREAELLPLNKAALFDALDAVGITRVVVTFDGSGDAGQIEDVAAFGGDDTPHELPDSTIAFRQAGFDDAEPGATMLSVHDALERLAYDMLEQTHGGWENEDGAYGEFTFDVAERLITLEYNERYIETHFHEHEF